MKDLIKRLRTIGARLTKTRRAVLEQMLSKNSPLSASELIAALKRRGLAVDRTTVYREIAFLLENDFIREVKIIGKASLFELSGEHCHHLICLKCNQVKTITMKNHLDEEERRIMKKEKFKISGHSLEFYGLCQKCQQKNL